MPVLLPQEHPSLTEYPDCPKKQRMPVCFKESSEKCLCSFFSHRAMVQVNWESGRYLMGHLQFLYSLTFFKHSNLIPNCSLGIQNKTMQESFLKTLLCFTKSIYFATDELFGRFIHAQGICARGLPCRMPRGINSRSPKASSGLRPELRAGLPRRPRAERPGRRLPGEGQGPQRRWRTPRHLHAAKSPNPAALTQVFRAGQASLLWTPPDLA